MDRCWSVIFVEKDFPFEKRRNRRVSFLFVFFFFNGNEILVQ